MPHRSPKAAGEDAAAARDNRNNGANAASADNLPVVTPAEAAVEMVEGSDDAGIVGLVVQEPWPAPSDTSAEDPWSGEGPVEKGLAPRACGSPSSTGRPCRRIRCRSPDRRSAPPAPGRARNRRCGAARRP
jgi:hypothetical protein